MRGRWPWILSFLLVAWIRPNRCVVIEWRSEGILQRRPERSSFSPPSPTTPPMISAPRKPHPPLPPPETPAPYTSPVPVSFSTPIFVMREGSIADWCTPSMLSGGSTPYQTFTTVIALALSCNPTDVIVQSICDADAVCSNLSARCQDAEPHTAPPPQASTVQDRHTITRNEGGGDGGGDRAVRQHASPSAESAAALSQPRTPSTQSPPSPPATHEISLSAFFSTGAAGPFETMVEIGEMATDNGDGARGEGGNGGWGERRGRGGQVEGKGLRGGGSSAKANVAASGLGSRSVQTGVQSGGQAGGSKGGSMGGFESQAKEGGMWVVFYVPQVSAPALTRTSHTSAAHLRRSLCPVRACARTRVAVVCVLSPPSPHGCERVCERGCVKGCVREGVREGV